MSGCIIRMKEMLNSLSPKEMAVAQFIIDNPTQVVSMSLEELARQSKASISSIVRLCKTMGYSGYKQLCMMVNSDNTLDAQSQIVYTDLRIGDSISSVIGSVGMTDIRSIENTMKLLDVKEMESAVNAIIDSKRVDFYGLGSSGIVALDAQNKFLRINKTSMASTDAHLQMLQATTLSKGDCAVLISYSGETSDILQTAQVAKASGATCISITGFGKNSLSSMCSIRLCCASSETFIRSGAMGSRISQLAIIDMLYCAVTSSQYDKVKDSLNRTRVLLNAKHNKA